jgi:hypothetical protein
MRIGVQVALLKRQHTCVLEQAHEATQFLVHKHSDYLLNGHTR